MTPEQTLAFIAFAVVMAATPGPSNTLLTATAAQVGILRAVPALLGVALGMALLLFVVTLGLGSLILANPAVLIVLRLAGVAVLLWLAFQIATSASAERAPSESPNARPVGFLAAAAFQWVNPKSWLACASAAAFLSPTPMGSAASAVTAALPATAVAQAATLALLFGAVAIPSCFPWLAFGALLHRTLRSPRAARLFALTMAALLAASALALLLT